MPAFLIVSPHFRWRIIPFQLTGVSFLSIVIGTKDGSERQVIRQACYVCLKVDAEQFQIKGQMAILAAVGKHKSSLCGSSLTSTFSCLFTVVCSMPVRGFVSFVCHIANTAENRIGNKKRLDK